MPGNGRAWCRRAAAQVRITRIGGTTLDHSLDSTRVYRICRIGALIFVAPRSERPCVRRWIIVSSAGQIQWWKPIIASRENKYEISGSGVVITPEGHVNQTHVARMRPDQVHFSDKTEMDLWWARTRWADLAIIKLGPRRPGVTVAFQRRQVAIRCGHGQPARLSQSVTPVSSATPK